VGKYATGTDFYCYNATATSSVSCGADIAPNSLTIKPNVAPVTYKNIGAMFTMAKNMSANPDGATGGNAVTNNLSTNTMNLTNLSQTRMLKDADWGAVVYLSTSDYGALGAGNAKVYNNGYYNSAATANSATIWQYQTGCGPVATGSDSYNTTCNAYYTEIGQTASTTGNTSGVYDMAGGVWEYAMANRNNTSDATYMATMPSAKYFNNYTVPPFGTQPIGSDSNEYYFNFDICAYETCGGHANYETITVQSASLLAQSWGGDYSRSVDSSGPWAYRGGRSSDGSNAGLFAVYRNTGNVSFSFGFRVLQSAF